MSRLLLLFTSLISVTLISASLAGCDREVPAHEERPRPVRTVVVAPSPTVSMLELPGEEGTGFRLAFMTPDHPSRPPGPEVFSGAGMILTVQVDDAAAAARRLEASGAPITHPLSAEPWGQKRFMTRDPAGLTIDVVEQIAPAEGFWERYAAA